MERDIAQIAKCDLLAKYTQLKLDSYQPEINKWLEEAAKDLDYGLRYATKMFKINAERRILNTVLYVIKGKEEITLKDLRAAVWEENRWDRAVPRSTCPLSNLVEQYKLDEAIATCHGHDYLVSKVFMAAQSEDNEYCAYYDAKAEANRKAREAERAIAEQKKRDERAARRAAKKGNV